jgi:hypothetical protein
MTRGCDEAQKKYEDILLLAHVTLVISGSFVV